MEGGLSDGFFFFQAEDGIRDKLVTGVQTCALPISIIVPRDVEPGTLVFHAGTYRDPDGTLRVQGGRVFTVTGLGDTVAEAAERSAAACELIAFQGKTYRRDIGWREIRRQSARAARS